MVSLDSRKRAWKRAAIAAAPSWSRARRSVSIESWMGKIGFLSSWARRRAISRQAATRSACTSRSRDVRSSAVMEAKARASSPTSSGASTATVCSRSPAPTPRARAASSRTGRAMRPERTSAVASAARRARAATPRVKRRTPPVTSASSVWGTATTSHKDGAERSRRPPVDGPREVRGSVPRGGSNAARLGRAAIPRARPSARVRCRASATSAPMRSDSSPRSSRVERESRRARRRATPLQVPRSRGDHRQPLRGAVALRDRLPAEVGVARHVVVPLGQPDARRPVAGRQDAAGAVDDLQERKAMARAQLGGAAMRALSSEIGVAESSSRTIAATAVVGLRAAGWPTRARTPSRPCPRRWRAARSSRSDTSAMTNTANRSSGGTATRTKAARSRPRRPWPRRPSVNRLTAPPMRPRATRAPAAVTRRPWTPDRAPRRKGQAGQGHEYVRPAQRLLGALQLGAAPVEVANAVGGLQRRANGGRRSGQGRQLLEGQPGLRDLRIPDEEPRLAGHEAAAAAGRDRLDLEAERRPGAPRRAGWRMAGRPAATRRTTRPATVAGLAAARGTERDGAGRGGSTAGASRAVGGLAAGEEVAGEQRAIDGRGDQGPCAPARERRRARDREEGGAGPSPAAGEARSDVDAGIGRARSPGPTIRRTTSRKGRPRTWRPKAVALRPRPDGGVSARTVRLPRRER